MSFAKYERFILDKITDTRLPGLSAALVKGDEVVWSRGFGFRDLKTGLAATPQTIYSIGSVTKSFTCIAIMQLAEAGKLKIDDPIDQYFPFDIQPGGEKVRIWFGEPVDLSDFYAKRDSIRTHKEIADFLMEEIGRLGNKDKEWIEQGKERN